MLKVKGCGSRCENISLRCCTGRPGLNTRACACTRAQASSAVPGQVGVQGLRLEGRARVVAKGETEPTWARRRHARGNHFKQRGAQNLRAVLADAGGAIFCALVISQAMYSPTRRSQVSSLRRKKPPSHRRQLAEAAPAQLPWR